MNTTFDLSAKIEFGDADDLDQRIIDAAARQLLEQISLTARYSGTVSTLIEEKLAEIVSSRIEAMLDKPMAQVDRYGDMVTGPPKLFREVFADVADKFLAARVDSNGRQQEGGYHTMARLEYLMHTVGAALFESECRKVAEQFKKELQEKAKQALTTVVAAHVEKASRA